MSVLICIWHPYPYSAPPSLHDFSALLHTLMHSSTQNVKREKKCFAIIAHQLNLFTRDISKEGMVLGYGLTNSFNMSQHA